MAAGQVVYTRCLKCNSRFKGIYLKCPKCSGPAILEYTSMSLHVEKGEASLWRYRDLLPEFPQRVSMGEGLTPLRIVDGVVVKNERKNPTGSYSDRASSVIASYLASSSRGVVRVEYVEDFAYSMAYYARSVVNGRIVIADPFEADSDELVQVNRLGFKVEVGDPEDADVPYINPLTFEGLKTILLEIYERRLNIENIVVPVERGALAFSLCKALRELEEMGADASYTIIGALARGSEEPWLLKYCGNYVRVEEIEPSEAVRALLKLSASGLRTKLVSALAYAAARITGNSLAVITIGEKHVRYRRRVSKLGSDILKVLEKHGELTAYEVWRILGGYSLRGVYKALKSLEDLGLVCTKHVVKGIGRKVRKYYPCEDSYIVE